MTEEVYRPTSLGGVHVVRVGSALPPAKPARRIFVVKVGTDPAGNDTWLAFDALNPDIRMRGLSRGMALVDFIQTHCKAELDIRSV